MDERSTLRRKRFFFVLSTGEIVGFLSLLLSHLLVSYFRSCQLRSNRMLRLDNKAHSGTATQTYFCSGFGHEAA